MTDVNNLDAFSQSAGPEYTGKNSFDGLSLHNIGDFPNPYEKAITIIGETLSKFDDDNLIPCFGFGDSSTHDRDVFSFYRDQRPCNGTTEALKRYREIVPHIRLAGMSNRGRTHAKLQKIVRMPDMIINSLRAKYPPVSSTSFGTTTWSDVFNPWDYLKELRTPTANEIEDQVRLFADHLEKENRQRASWNDFQTEFLLQLLKCFLRAERGGWSNETWNTVAKEFREKFPKSNFTIEQLKQKEKDMRKLYKHINQILKRPGFQWDDKNCKLDASKDCWKELIKESDGKLSGYRKKTIPFYAALVALNKDLVEAELEDAGYQTFADSVSLPSPKADEMALHLSSLHFEDNHSHDYDTNSRTFPLNPLSSPFNPQNNHNYNAINPSFQVDTSGPSNFKPSSSDFAQDQPMFRASEGSIDKFNISEKISDQPLDSTNIPPSGVASLNDCENPNLFLDGTSVNLSSPNADERVQPLSPGFWESSLFVDNHSNDHDTNSRTFRSNPLSSPFNPQNNHYNSPIIPYFQTGTSGPSNFQASSYIAQDQPLLQASEGSMNKFNISEKLSDQPLDSTNIPPYGVESLNDCENPNLFLASEGSMNYTNMSQKNLQSTTFPPNIPLFQDCENQSLSNNDTDIPHHQSFSAPLCQSDALNSENSEKKDNLSLERDPIRKIRGKRNGKKKGAAKIDYSMERCINCFADYQGLKSLTSSPL